MASLFFNWKRVEAESRILKQSSEHRERQFSKPLKCLKIWEALSRMLPRMLLENFSTITFTSDSCQSVARKDNCLYF